MKASNGNNTIRYYHEKIKESDVDVDVDVDDDDVDDEVEIDSKAEEEIQNRRDEVVEVRKMSSKDTNRLRWWRVVMTGVLLLTACVITFTTYTLLEQQEDRNFKTAVRFTSCLCHVIRAIVDFLLLYVQNNSPISLPLYPYSFYRGTMKP